MERKRTGHSLAVVNQGSQFDECRLLGYVFKSDDVDQTLSNQRRYVHWDWLIVSAFGIGCPRIDRFVFKHILCYLELCIGCGGDLSETSGRIQVEETAGVQHNAPREVSHDCRFTLRLLPEQATGEVDGQRFEVSFFTKVRCVGQPLDSPPGSYPVNPQKSRQLSLCELAILIRTDS